MTLDLFLRISHVQVFLAILIVILCGLYLSRRCIESKVLGAHYLFGLLPPLIFLLVRFTGKENNIPQNLYLVLQLPIISLLFYKAVMGKYRGLFISVTLGYLVFGFINVLFIQKTDINSYTKILSSLILIFYCFLYYYRLLVVLPVQHLHKLPMFWYTIAFLMYNAGTLFLMLFASYLVEVLHNDLLIYWTFHNILDIVQNLIVMVGLWKELQNIRSRSLLPLVQS